ncbi:MAG: alpha/beta hydrolase [Gammaproteobacteria bacterium]|nr:alpha/beta hydrolase [Gammaproteobacteria bacterium]
MSNYIPQLAGCKESFWVSDGDARLYTVLHYPSGGKMRRTGVVICNPLGHEYVHSYRALRHLADRLANAGFPVIRFDYEGTGNSSGDMNDAGLVEKWQSNVKRQVDFLSDRFSLQNCSLVGFRFGAQLAESVCDDAHCTPLVLWAPFKTNKKCLREIKALSRLSDYEQLSDDQLECAGFVYSNELLQQIGDMKLSTPDISVDSRALLIGPNPAQYTDLIDRFPSIKSVEQSAVELENSMLEPHHSEIPEFAIESIETFLVDQCGDLCATRTGGTNPSASASTSSTVNESVIWQDAPRISGVLAQNSRTSRDNTTVVVLPNAGSVHSIGPNRVYVELARCLAENGIASFRFDLPNLGDAVLGHELQENHPYPGNAVAATGDVISYLKDELGFERTVLAGICSGSYTAFRYALDSDNSGHVDLAMINPLTFYWEDGMQLRLGAGQVGLGEAKYYDRAMGNLQSWKRLLTGQSEFRAIFKFVCQQVLEKIRFCTKLFLDKISVSPPTKLAQELRHITDSGNPITLFISSRDIGYDLMKAEALSAVASLERQNKLRVQIIEDGDHTFSRSKERGVFIDLFVRYATALDSKAGHV